MGQKCKKLLPMQSFAVRSKNETEDKSVPNFEFGSNTLTTMARRCKKLFPFKSYDASYSGDPKGITVPNQDLVTTVLTILELTWNTLFPLKTYAVPYDDKSNGNSITAPDFVTHMGDSGFISLRREDEEETDLDNNMEVTTISRYSYKLDRYRKNAMVIFFNDCYEEAHSDIEEVKTCFEKFRFEVEVYRNKTGDELRRILLKFFLRDFTEYGAVAIVVLAPTSNVGYRPDFITPGSNFKYEDINKYLTTLTPPTLRSKPKILISNNHSENIDNNSFRKQRSMSIEFLQSRRYDMMELWLSNHPLRFLCQEMTERGHQKSFQDVIFKVIHKIEEPCWLMEGSNGSMVMGSLSKAVNFYKTA